MVSKKILENRWVGLRIRTAFTLQYILAVNASSGIVFSLDSVHPFYYFFYSVAVCLHLYFLSPTVWHIRVESSMYYFVYCTCYHYFICCLFYKSSLPLLYLQFRIETPSIVSTNSTPNTTPLESPDWGKYLWRRTTTLEVVSLANSSRYYFTTTQSCDFLKCYELFMFW